MIDVGGDHGFAIAGPIGLDDGGPHGCAPLICPAGFLCAHLLMMLAATFPCDCFGENC
jgi:hypothetical protein